MSRKTLELHGIKSIMNLESNSKEEVYEGLHFHDGEIVRPIDYATLPEQTVLKIIEFIDSRATCKEDGEVITKCSVRGEELSSKYIPAS